MTEQAHHWIRSNTLPGGAGMIYHTRQRVFDPELTGYLIPTLLALGERELAVRYADQLLAAQQPDGSFIGPEGRPLSVRAVGCLLRGWVELLSEAPRLDRPLRRACDWLMAQAEITSGRFSTSAQDAGALGRDALVESGQLYALVPLARAGTRLGEERYLEFADRAKRWHLAHSDPASFERSHQLTHQFCEVQDALLDLDEEELARTGMAELAGHQRENGGLPGGFDAPWLSAPSQFMAAMVWYRLGDKDRAGRALAWGERFRNPSGGFFGSHGVGASFFPAAETGLALKLYLDACRLRSGAPVAAGPALPVIRSREEMPAGNERPLDAEEWHEAITGGARPEEVAARVRQGTVPEWVKPVLELTRPGDVVLEQGSGTAAMSAWLALQGRRVVLLDYSQPCLDFGLAVFKELGLPPPQVVRADIRQALPLADASVDFVWSSGVLEHFSDDEIVHILSESKRVSRRQVFSLVPNARSLAYRLGKWDQEQGGRWKYGYEDPKLTLAHLFARAGLLENREFTIGALHSLNFLDTPELAPARTALGRFLKGLPAEQGDQLGQGYLLGTVGWVRAPRRLAVVPSDPLEAYDKKGNGHLLKGYFNPAGFFDEVYCLSPKEPTGKFAHGMRVIPTRQDELAARIRDLRIDVVRAYGGYWACDFATAAKVPGVPVIVSVHDRRPDWLHDSIREADVVISVSAPVTELVRQRGVPTDRIRSVPNRVDFDVFLPCDDPSARAEFDRAFPARHRIVHVGRKSPEKNADTLIRALALLGPDYCAVFIGPGNVEPLRKVAVETGTEDRCHFLPARPNEELHRFYSFADCVCMPSRSEGFGIVFIEALASEGAVIASDLSPMNQYIRDGHNGLLVADHENPAALAGAIRRLCNDPVLNRSLRAVARESVRPFARPTVDAAEAALYHSVLAERAPAVRTREKTKKDWPLHPLHQTVKDRLRTSRSIVDLGCGNNPVAGATAAVDLYVAPEQRSLGHGSTIDLEKFAKRGIRFVNARVDGPLPFKDKEFDFAYSHHVFEHLEDPATACREMVRIAKAGAVITPSPFSELAFGRPYHLWLVADRGGKLVFLSKRKDEDRPFGVHPDYKPGRGWFATPNTNPFDIALNYGDWNNEVDGPQFERLGRRLRELWHTRSPVIETIFLWEGSFECLVIDER